MWSCSGFTCCVNTTSIYVTIEKKRKKNSKAVAVDMSMLIPSLLYRYCYSLSLKLLAWLHDVKHYIVYCVGSREHVATPPNRIAKSFNSCNFKVEIFCPNRDEWCLGCNYQHILHALETPIANIFESRLSLFEPTLTCCKVDPYAWGLHFEQKNLYFFQDD